MNNTRIVAIGDIHGCYYTLKTLWDKINPTKDDVIIFLGDYIDRGPHSYEVIEFLKQKKTEFPYLTLLVGNHEDLCRKAIVDNDSYLWYMNGGGTTVASFEQHNKNWSSMLSFIADLDTWCIIEEYNLLFVHAGMPNATEPEDESFDNLIWSRTFKNKSDYSIVCGHTRHQRPQVYHNPNEILCIDTGCVNGGSLTAAIFTRPFTDPAFISADKDEKDFG